MDQQKFLESLRRVLAEAIILGTKLTDHDYHGVLWGPDNREVWRSLNQLHDSTASFLNASGLPGLSIDDVLPLHTEMRTLVERSAEQRS